MIQDTLTWVSLICSVLTVISVGGAGNDKKYIRFLFSRIHCEKQP